MRLIDADKFIEYLDIGHLRSPSEICFSEGGVKVMIDIQPTIEAVPVVHGEWIAQDEGLTKFMCSICKGKNYGGHEKFCPNCGADMRKKV
jgi:hypothetical protein